jgi:hypothetical protein
MALNTNRVTSLATPGIAAAATGRPMSGGRNVAGASGQPLEAMGFAADIGISDNRLLRYDDDLHFDFNQQGETGHRGTPFIVRSAAGFRAEAVDEVSNGDGGETFLSMVMQGVGTYERNMRVTAPGAVRPGSVMNYQY